MRIRMQFTERLAHFSSRAHLARVALALVGFLLSGTALTVERPQPWDFLVRDARIVDGSGNPWFKGSVAISHGRIAWIGTTLPPSTGAAHIIDAAGRVLAPGFIDLMGQNTLLYIQVPDVAASKLTQGVTTHFSGEGWSHAPLNERTRPKVPELVDGKPVQWHDFAEYFSILESRGLPLNVIHNVGAEQVRRAVLGEEGRAPTPNELNAMRSLVDQAMQQGAAGLSSALIYPPGAFASTDELVELAKVVSRYGGFYSTHLRNESGDLLAAIDEAIAIGRRANVPVHIYHLKAAGVANWPLMAEAVQHIEDARKEGLDVTADVYPYVRNGIRIGSFVPPSFYLDGDEAFLRAMASESTRVEVRRQIESDSAGWENWYQHVGRDWQNVLITGDQAGKDVVGLSVSEAAKVRGQSDWNFLFDLLRVNVAVAPLSMNEDQKRLALRRPWVMISSDAAPASPLITVAVHPRAYGTFPRVLAKYVREDHVLSLEDAIRRMTSAPANLLGLYDRGRIAIGLAADLVLFDPDRIQDRATFSEPSQRSIGVDYVWVNGVLAIDNGNITRARAGKVLRFEGHGASH
jgi:N-acyl-D-amino-acid deacylase